MLLTHAFTLYSFKHLTVRFGNWDTFHVDEKTGKIFLSSKLDPEKTSQYEILIKVTDGGSLFVSNQRKAHCKLHNSFIATGKRGNIYKCDDILMICLDISASRQIQELGKFLVVKFSMCKEKKQFNYVI